MQIIADPDDFKNDWFKFYKTSIPLKREDLDKAFNFLDNIKQHLRYNGTRVFSIKETNAKILILAQPIKPEGFQLAIHAWYAENYSSDNALIIRCDIYSAEDSIMPVIFKQLLLCTFKIHSISGNEKFFIESLSEKEIKILLESADDKVLNTIKENMPNKYKEKMKLDLAEQIITKSSISI